MRDGAGLPSGLDILTLSKQNPKAIFDLCREENQFYILCEHVGSPSPKTGDYNACPWLAKKTWKTAIKRSVEIVENILQSVDLWAECLVCTGVLGLAEHVPAEKHLSRLWNLLPAGKPVVEVAKTLWQTWELPFGIVRFNHLHGQVWICRGRKPTNSSPKGLEEAPVEPQSPPGGGPGSPIPASPVTAPVSFAPAGFQPQQFASAAPAPSAAPQTAAPPAPAPQRAQDHGFPTCTTASAPSVGSFVPDGSSRFAAAAPPTFGSRSMGFPAAPAPSWDVSSEVSFAPGSNFATARPAPSEVSFASGANFATQAQPMAAAPLQPMPAPAPAPAPAAPGVESPAGLEQEGEWVTIEPPCSEATRPRGDYTAYHHLQGQKLFKAAMTPRAGTFLRILNNQEPQCTVCDRHRGYEEHLGAKKHWDQLYEKKYTKEGVCIEDVKDLLWNTMMIPGGCVRLNELTGEIQMSKGSTAALPRPTPAPAAAQAAPAPAPGFITSHCPAPTPSASNGSDLWGRYVPSQPMQPAWSQGAAGPSQPAPSSAAAAPACSSPVPEMNVSNLMYIAQKNLESKAKILQQQLLNRNDRSLDQYMCSVCDMYVRLRDTAQHFGSVGHLNKLARDPTQEQVFNTTPPMRLRHVDLTLEINEGSTGGWSNGGEVYDV